MDSAVSRDAEKELVAITQRLTPEERLNAFLDHCLSMTELHEAGQKMHAQKHKSAS